MVSRALVAVVVAAALSAILAACSGSGAGLAHSNKTSSTSTTAPPSSSTTTTTVVSTTTTAASSQVLLPVAACDTTMGNGQVEPPHPSKLPITLAPGIASQVSFYASGPVTVLGPKGWTCSALVAATGGQVLTVYRPGDPQPNGTTVPAGQPVVAAVLDNTGHLPGAELICGLFPSSSAAKSVEENGVGGCSAPRGETHKQLTGDIVTFVDPSGVTGNGIGSGGKLSSNGAAIYPQVADPTNQGINISIFSCTLPADMQSLCNASVSDFTTRMFPASPTG